MTSDPIARLEAATGPDRELDGIIWVTIAGDGDGSRIPAYTASLDAALTLVPEGWYVARLFEIDGLGWDCELRTRRDGVALADRVDTTTDRQGKRTCSTRPTPAIALCIAALKAREDDTTRTAEGK